MATMGQALGLGTYTALTYKLKIEPGKRRGWYIVTVDQYLKGKFDLVSYSKNTKDLAKTLETLKKVYVDVDLSELERMMK